MREPVPQYPGYYADEDGRIYSTVRNVWRELKQNEHNGFYEVHLVVDGKKINVPVHRLVLYAFVGPKPAGRQAVHLNHDKLDNTLDNLCWSDDPRCKQRRKVSPKAKRKLLSLTRLPKKKGTKLTAEQMESIVDQLNHGISVKEVAKQFSVSRQAIYDVISRCEKK